MSSPPPKRPASTPKPKRAPGKPRPVSGKAKSVGGGRPVSTPKAKPRGKVNPTANAAKRMSKRVSKRKKEFGGEYLLIDLELYHGDESQNRGLAAEKKLIADASVVRRHGAVLDVKSKVCLCVSNWHNDETKRYGIYCGALYACKVKLASKGVRYVLFNQLYAETASRRNAAYNFNSVLPFYELVSQVAHVMLLEKPRPDLLTTALIFRALTRNHTCQSSVYEVLRPAGFFQRFDVQQGGKKKALPDGFNAGFLYACTHMRRGFDAHKVPPTKAGAFLRKRGLNNRRALIEAWRQGDEFSAVGDTRIAAYSDFKDDQYTISALQNAKLPKLNELLKIYPTATIPYPVIDDPFIRMESINNVFEIISSGLVFEPKQELRGLAQIQGKSDGQVYMCAFLIAFFRGYVDLRGARTITTVIKAPNSMVANLLSAENWDGGNRLRLPCCSNEEHYMEMAPCNPSAQNRRVVYVGKGKADGGECCYRFMMQKYLPKLTIVE